MYPVYPLLAFMAACALSSITAVVERSPLFFYTSAVAPSSSVSPVRRQDLDSFGLLISRLFLAVVYLTTAALFVSRISANHRNYGGEFFQQSIHSFFHLRVVCIHLIAIHISNNFHLFVFKELCILFNNFKYTLLMKSLCRIHGAVERCVRSNIF